MLLETILHFEEDIAEINDIFKKKSPKEINLHFEKGNNSSNDKIENIHNVLNKINQVVTIDISTTTKKIVIKVTL